MESSRTAYDQVARHRRRSVDSTFDNPNRRRAAAARRRKSFDTNRQCHSDRPKCSLSQQSPTHEMSDPCVMSGFIGGRILHRLSLLAAECYHSAVRAIDACATKKIR